MHTEIINYIENIIKYRKPIVDLAVKQRSKFEGWLKFEIADSLIKAGVENIILEAPYLGMRSDIGFIHGNIQYYLELKTCNTNYRIKDIDNKNRPITKNIDSIIEDVNKLRNCPGVGLVSFILFPIPINDDRYVDYIEKITYETNYNLIDREHYKRVNMGNYDIVICCFQVSDEKRKTLRSLKELITLENSGSRSLLNGIAAEKSVSYYIYENWIAEKKAVIHKSNCTFCNEGQGTGRNKLKNKNGKWHGSFDTYEEAKKIADSLKDREVRNCGFCIK